MALDEDIDLYGLLGVSKHASSSDIKKVFSIFISRHVDK